MIARYLSTLRHLKPVQMYSRPIFAVKRRFVRVCSQDALDGLAARARASLARGGADMPIMDWVDGAQEKLHRYRLNAFEWPPPQGSDAHALIADWIAQNTDERAESWEPYVISRRIPNWLRLLDGCEVGDDRGGLIAESMFWQLRRLSIDVEHHLQANHLIENYRALFMGSLRLLCRASTPILERRQLRVSALMTWCTRGLIGLHEELHAQILDDGAHYERSPMYHAVLTEGIRDLVAFMERWGGVAPPALRVRTYWSLVRQRCEAILPKMDAWLSRLTHPDGAIALFHDSAFDGVPVSQCHCDPPRDGTALLEPSGFYIRRWGDGHYFAMDCGEPSPRHQPAHAHCSILSYEFSVARRRMIVDSGCGSYQHPEIRQYCRSTAAHNVPMVEGAEQSEIWGAFRMGRRATVCARREDRSPDRVECRIRDFRGNVMSRRVTFTSDTIQVDDVLERRATTGRFVSRIHLAPEVSADRIEILGPFEVHPAAYYPEFGRRVDTRVVHCLAVPTEPNRITYRIWYGS